MTLCTWCLCSAAELHSLVQHTRQLAGMAASQPPRLIEPRRIFYDLQSSTQVGMPADFRVAGALQDCSSPLWTALTACAHTLGQLP